MTCGIIAACGTGSLIPPSNGYIMYSILSDTSISKMFMASYLPAFLLFALFCGVVIIMYLIKPGCLFEDGIVRKPDLASRPNFKEKLKITWRALPTLLGPILMFVFLYGGFLTATECAAFLLMYSIIVTVVIKRSLTIKQLYKAMVDAVHTSSQVLCIMGMAFIFSTVISQTGISTIITEWTKSVGMGYYTVFLFLFLILLVLGMCMPAASARIVTLPIFLPIAVSVGIDPLLLGVFYAICLEFASFTPPFGMSLIVMKSVSGSTYGDALKGVVPFALMFLLALILVVVFPEIALILPQTMAQ